MSDSIKSSEIITWAIFGSSGFVGGAIAQELKRQGERVRVVKAPRLSVSHARTLESLQDQLSASHELITELARELSGCAIVINAAGVAAPDAADTDDLFGANSLLPALIGRASALASVPSFLHVSSAAVQGHRSVLDDSAEYQPFSPYSLSKALGEQMILSDTGQSESMTIIRATSVQGVNRQTTLRLQKIARSLLASVAAPGNYASVVSSIDGLVRYTLEVARRGDRNKSIHLQPWEGATTLQVLYWAGGERIPRQLPPWFCRSVLRTLRKVSRIFQGRFNGAIRRLELMWFGQDQFSQSGSVEKGMSTYLRQILANK